MNGRGRGPLPRLPLIALLGLAAATLSAAKCPSLASSRAQAPFAPRRDAGDSSDGKLFGMRTPVTHYSESRGILSARVARVSDEGMHFELEDAVFMVRDSAARDTLRVASPRATYDLRAPRVSFTGGVTMTGTDGRQLTTAAAWFDPARNLVVGDSAYAFQRPLGAARQSGNAFEADARLLRVTPRARGAPVGVRSAPPRSPRPAAK